jgi:hypothetical protein
LNGELLAREAYNLESNYSKANLDTYYLVTYSNAGHETSYHPVSCHGHCDNFVCTEEAIEKENR